MPDQISDTQLDVVRSINLLPHKSGSPQVLVQELIDATIHQLDVSGVSSLHRVFNLTGIVLRTVA